MDYALVILCGGNSTRMGTDKALLPFGEECLIESIVKKYKPFFSHIYLSVKKKGDYAHLNLPVTEIADIYPNAGPMSGVFSGLSMMDEPAAFFMSVDTPFLDPTTGIMLLKSMEDSDICMIEGKSGSIEPSTAAYSKNCTAAVGKCLLLRQFTFDTLQEKCQTKYLTESDIAEGSISQFPDRNGETLPMNEQFFNLDTRADYYQALRKLGSI